MVLKRFQLKSTSSASTARPLTGATGWNLTPGRSLKVIVSRSGEVSQDWAMSPIDLLARCLHDAGLEAHEAPQTVS